MDGKYRISEPEGIYFITFSTIGWVDVFTRQRYRDIIIESLNFCVEKKGFIIYSWVIMSNHLHFIFSIAGRNSSTNKYFQLWKHDNHAIEVYSNEVIDQKIDYVHMNPVRSGIVAQPEDYLYSSALDYCDGKGLVKVEVMERSGYETI